MRGYKELQAPIQGGDLKRRKVFIMTVYSIYTIFESEADSILPARKHMKKENNFFFTLAEAKQKADRQNSKPFPLKGTTTTAVVVKEELNVLYGA